MLILVLPGEGFLMHESSLISSWPSLNFFWLSQTPMYEMALFLLKYFKSFFFFSKNEQIFQDYLLLCAHSWMTWKKEGVNKSRKLRLQLYTSKIPCWIIMQSVYLSFTHYISDSLITFQTDLIYIYIYIYTYIYICRKTDNNDPSGRNDFRTMRGDINNFKLTMDV